MNNTKEYLSFLAAVSQVDYSTHVLITLACDPDSTPEQIKSAQTNKDQAQRKAFRIAWEAGNGYDRRKKTR